MDHDSPTHSPVRRCVSDDTESKWSPFVSTPRVPESPLTELAALTSKTAIESPVPSAEGDVDVVTFTPFTALTRSAQVHAGSANSAGNPSSRNLFSIFSPTRPIVPPLDLGSLSSTSPAPSPQSASPLSLPSPVGSPGFSGLCVFGVLGVGCSCVLGCGHVATVAERAFDGHGTGVAQYAQFCHSASDLHEESRDQQSFGQFLCYCAQSFGLASRLYCSVAFVLLVFFLFSYLLCVVARSASPSPQHEQLE